MRSVRLVIVAVMATIAGCAFNRQTLSPPMFTRGIWRIRIDVDSAPSRLRPSDKPVFGTIDFATARYAIDFWVAINHRIPNGAYIVAGPQLGEGQPRRFKIILGDSSSFDEKLVLVGQQVARDSIVGTWSETIVCCSAAGRFTLWRRERE